MIEVDDRAMPFCCIKSGKYLNYGFLQIKISLCTQVFTNSSVL